MSPCRLSRKEPARAPVAGGLTRSFTVASASISLRQSWSSRNCERFRCRMDTRPSNDRSASVRWVTPFAATLPDEDCRLKSVVQTVERPVEPDVDGRPQLHRPDRGKHLADFRDRQGIRMDVESKHRSGAILPDGAVHLQGRFRRVERDAAELKIVAAELHQTDSARDDDVGVSRGERKPGDVEREVARPVSKRQTGLDRLERDRLLTGPGHREGPVVDCDLADRNRPAFGVRLVLLLALDEAPEVPPAGVVMHGDDGTRHVDAIDDDAFRDHVSDAVSRNDPVDRDDREAVHHHAHVVDLHALIEVAAQPSERQRGVEALVQGANDVPAQPLLEPRAFDSHGRHERDAHDDRQDHRDDAEDPEEPAHGQNA